MGFKERHPAKIACRKPNYVCNDMRLSIGAAKLVQLPACLAEIVDAARHDVLQGGGVTSPQVRGLSHEGAVRDWAEKVYVRPPESLLTSCFVSASMLPRGEARPGVKQEFDAIVLGADGCVRAIIECKAGCDIYGDLFKALRARTRFFVPKQHAHLQIGKCGETRVLPIGNRAPHLMYVLGSGGTLGEVVLRSALPAEIGTMLDRELQGEVFPPLFVEPKGRVRVSFSAEVVADSQQRLDAFLRTISDLVRRDELSFWA